MAKSSKLIRSLRSILGRERVLISNEAKLVYATDAWLARKKPECIVFPESVDEVAQVVKIAHSLKIPLTARGAGTGMSGGAVPVDGGIVVSMVRMNRILEINHYRKTAIVEPGVITAELQKRANEVGLFFPPDPSSAKTCTIGGNIAENAGGLRCVKYGVTADYILGLEVVDWRGEIIRTGIFDNNSGIIDLTQLFCASEGMLGIVVKAALKLVNRPQSVMTLQMEFPQVESAMKTVMGMLNLGILPCILEFIDKQTLRAVLRFMKLDLSAETAAVLLVEFDEGDELNNQYYDKSIAIAKDMGLISVKKAADDEERDKLWTLRRSISPALRRIASGKLSEDIAIPRGRVADLVEFVNRLSKDMNIIIPIYGHAGDGNLHINFLYDKCKPEEFELVRQGVVKVIEEVVRLEGTMTGEHGIGLAKKSYISLQFSPEIIKLQQQLKNVFDEDNIFNYDKMF